MNKQAFTPGPWSIGGKYAHKSVLLNAQGESIASGGNNRVVQGEVLEVSLRLASAAPELLAVAQAVVDGYYSEEGCNWKAVAHAAQSAIAKATGAA